MSTANESGVILFREESDISIRGEETGDEKRHFERKLVRRLGVKTDPKI